MAITHDTGHSAAMLERLLSQYESSENLRDLVSILGAEVQSLEDLIYSLESDFLDLSEAEGVQLDIWGAVLGRRREGLDDVAFRRLLGAWQGALRAQGRVDHITQAVAVLLDHAGVHYRRMGEAAFRLEWETASSISPSLSRALEAVLEAAAPSGVAYTAVEGEVGAFRFDVDGVGFDSGHLAGRVL